MFIIEELCESDQESGNICFVQDTNTNLQVC